MSEATTIVAEARAGVGKGAARQARREGKVPGVIYGDKQPARPINVNFIELSKLVRRGGFMKTVFEINVDGQSERAIPRDLQLDPILDFPIHVDFLRVHAGSTVVVEIPVHFEGEEQSPGLKRGGVLNIVRHTVEMVVPADNIPAFLTASLDGLDIGDSLHISAIPLPAGATPTITDRDFTVATIVGAAGTEAAPADADVTEAEPKDEES